MRQYILCNSKASMPIQCLIAFDAYRKHGGRFHCRRMRQVCMFTALDGRKARKASAGKYSIYVYLKCRN